MSLLFDALAGPLQSSPAALLPVLLLVFVVLALLLLFRIESHAKRAADAMERTERSLAERGSAGESPDRNHDGD